MKNKSTLISILLVLLAIIAAHSTHAPTGIFVNKAQNPTQILFTGDVMLDRGVRATIDSHGFDYIFSNIKNIFEGADIAVGNLEGTITANPSVSVKDNNILHFTFDPSVAQNLKSLGFTGFSQANNHALDFGQDGYLVTQANLNSVDLFAFGSPSNDLNLSKEVKIGDENICFVGYHALYVEATKPIVDEIARIRPECTFIAVFAHWGVEYETAESDDQIREAHDFIDAGADLIIGAHPHVIEPIEIYKGRAIFYSLGNFVFDQSFSIATRQGLAVRLELGPTTEAFHLIGIEARQNKLYFPEKESFQPRTDILISELPKDLAQEADIDGILKLSR